MPTRVLRVLPLVAVLSLVVSLLAPAGAAGQTLRQVPPGPTVRFQSTFAPTDPPAQFDLIQQVVDFAPGSYTPPHTHGGQVFVTTLAGEMTLRHTSPDGTPAGPDHRAGTGQTWIENPGEFMVVGNAGSTPAPVLVTFVLPRGAPITAAGSADTSQLPPGPTARHRTDLAVETIRRPFEVVQIVLDFAPGTWTPPHTHGGPVVVTVLEGEMTVRERGTERRIGVGGSWTESPGQVLEAGNATGARAVIAVSFAVPVGAPLTTVVAPAVGLPRTGAGPAGATLPAGLPVAVGLLAGTGLLAAGWRLRRPRLAEPQGEPRPCTSGGESPPDVAQWRPARSPSSPGRARRA